MKNLKNIKYLLGLGLLGLALFLADFNFYSLLLLGGKSFYVILIALLVAVNFRVTIVIALLIWLLSLTFALTGQAGNSDLYATVAFKYLIIGVLGAALNFFVDSRK